MQQLSGQAQRQVTLDIIGMTCAACATRIEKGLNRIDGVQATVNLTLETARIEFVPAKTTVGEVIGPSKRSAIKRRRAPKRRTTARAGGGTSASSKRRCCSRRC